MSTLSQLRARVRYNLGEPNPTATPRFANASINNHLNEAYSQYQTELIENGEGDLAKKTTINLVANQEAYALPSDWLKTKKVERAVTFGTVPLTKFERYEAANVTISGNAGDWYLPTYRFRDRSLVFEPFPTFSQTAGIIHEYYALQPVLSADGDSPVSGFIEPWQSMMVLWATIAELEGKEAVGGVVAIDTFRARLEKMETRFQVSMQGRSEARDSVEPYGYNYEITSWNW